MRIKVPPSQLTTVDMARDMFAMLQDTFPTPYLDSELANLNKTIKLYYSGKIGGCQAMHWDCLLV